MLLDLLDALLNLLRSLTGDGCPSRTAFLICLRGLLG
jgi:hypothetical protein